MDYRSLLRQVVFGLGLMAAVLATFYLVFHPYVLHPLLGREWTADDGVPLTDWQPLPNAPKCPVHQAYHLDRTVCVPEEP